MRSKRTKLKKSSKRNQRKRFIQTPIVSSEADLATHVQTVYSSDLEELLGDGHAGSCNEDVTKNLQRHPALVLNADYQVSLLVLVTLDTIFLLLPTNIYHLLNAHSHYECYL